MSQDTFTESAPTLKFGTVSAVDEAGMRVRVRLPDVGNLRTQWLPVLTRKSLRDKDYWLPDTGEHVAVLLDAQGEDGVVLGAIFSQADATPVADRDIWQRRFADGAELEYHRGEHVLTVRGGVERVVIEAGQEITLKAGQRITLDTPDAVCTGNLQVQGLLSYENGLAGRGGRAGAAAVIHGDVQVEGQIALEGDMQATGSIMDAGGNSNHHSHGN